MKKYIHVLLLLLFTGLSCFQGTAQNTTEKEYPVIGKPIPDFTLTDIEYFRQKKATKSDLKGKPVILDFFAMGCSSCFASFPKLNKLHQQFKDQVDIILVGKEHEKIRETYEKFRKKQKLELPVTYESKIFERWGIRGVPRVIWIDAEGIVKAVTSSPELNAENIQVLIKGNKFTFRADYSKKEKASEVNIFEKALLIGGNGGQDMDFTFRSILYPWDPATKQRIPWSIENLLGDPKKRKKINMAFYGYQCTGACLWQLYKIAYLGYDRWYDPTGNWYNLPILELSDPSKFEHDFSTGKNVYNYSIIVPEEKGSPAYIQKIMQQDLERYLGISASVEKRMAPYWRVSATEKAKRKLKTKHPGITPKVEGSHAGRKYRNVTMKSIVQGLNSYHQGGPAIVDETGIDYNVDLYLDALLTDFEDIKKELKKQGLILEKAEKEMTVLVIKDAEQVK